MNSVENSYPLNGSWIPIKQELAGNAFPESVFHTFKLEIKDSTYSYGTVKKDKGVLIYKQGKMDIYGREGVNQGKHFTALYKKEKNLMTICYNLKGDGYPTGFDTKGNPLYFLSVFKLDNSNP